MVWDIAAIVVVAIRNDRPAIISTGHNMVDFITATWAHFVKPKLAVRCKRKTIRVAVIARPDLCPHATLSRHGIIVWRRTVEVETKYLSQCDIRVLRSLRTSAIT